MKQGTLSLLAVNVGMDLSLCHRIEFIFKQNDKEKLFEFPSEKVIQRGERTLDFIWTEDDKEIFKPNSVIELDTRITLKDSPYQPDTMEIQHGEVDS